ncbi:Zn finger-containing GTPase- Activating Protein for ARF [Phlyctochytrium bullatum]|nr:Zn finger-containing GTPase- Activating Protein for ARF [Phlyctochytrium bullatum]
MSINEKYNSDFAKLYREKLTAVCENRTWTMPAISHERRSEPPRQPPQQSRSFGSAGVSSSSSNSFGSNGNGNSSYSGPIPSKSQNESFFARKGLENETRDPNLPPSQGGKYAGFGSSYTPPPKEKTPFDNGLNDAFDTLSLGWSFLASTVTKGAEMAVAGAENLGQHLTEKVIKPTTAALRDPDFQTQVSSTINSLQQKVVQGGSQGIAIVSSLLSDRPPGTSAGRQGRPNDWDDFKANENSGYDSSHSKKSLDWDDWKEDNWSKKNDGNNDRSQRDGNGYSNGTGFGGRSNHINGYERSEFDEFGAPRSNGFSSFEDSKPRNVGENFDGFRGSDSKRSSVAKKSSGFGTFDQSPRTSEANRFSDDPKVSNSGFGGERSERNGFGSASGFSGQVASERYSTKGKKDDDDEWGWGDEHAQKPKNSARQEVSSAKPTATTTPSKAQDDDWDW